MQPEEPTYLCIYLHTRKLTALSLKKYKARVVGRAATFEEPHGSKYEALQQKCTIIDI